MLRRATLTTRTFDHVLIVARDLERSIEFYSLLGFEHLETIQRPNDRVAVMRLGNVKIELMNLPEGKETTREPRKLSDLGFRHIGFKVDDLEEVYDRLKDKISFQAPPRKIPGRGNRMTVFFKDPDGVEMHFVQE
jgi:glyoxylase I family protein